jgi:hypothetical protein
MKIAHFFDIDTLIDLSGNIWIIDKNNPNIPILKISKSDFNLIKSGIYKSQGNKIDYNGQIFWLPNDIFNKLKVKLKLNDVSLGNIGISLQEFLNKDIIDNIKFDLNLEIIEKLKNKTDDIYVVCSKQTMNVYQKTINKVNEKLKEEGILIKKFYFINESFYDQDDDSNRFKKIRLLLQHLVGYKTQVNKFINEEIKRYDEIYFYDNQNDTLKIENESNIILKRLIDSSEDGIKSVIKEDLEEYKPVLIVNFITDNTSNRIISKKVKIEYSRLIRTFESFISKYL